MATIGETAVAGIRELEDVLNAERDAFQRRLAVEESNQIADHGIEVSELQYSQSDAISELLDNPAADLGSHCRLLLEQTTALSELHLAHAHDLASLREKHVRQAAELEADVARRFLEAVVVLVEQHADAAGHFEPLPRCASFVDGDENSSDGPQQPRPGAQGGWGDCG